MAAQAAGLEVSQFAYRSSDLLVFVKTPDDAASAPQARLAGAAVALGTKGLRVKSAEAWNAQAGAVVVVAVDVSGSMRSLNFPSVRSSVAAALTTLPGASQAGLLTIGAHVQTAIDVGPVSAVTAALEGLVADAPETALNEGLLRAQEWAMEGRAGWPLRRFVLLVTDGVDDSKKAIGTDEMRTKVQAGEVPIYMIAVLPASVAKPRMAGLEPLASVARASGGAFMTSTVATLGTDLQALLADAMRADLVTAACGDCPKDGGLRELQVSLPRGDGSIWGVRQVRLLHHPGEDAKATDPIVQPVKQPPPSLIKQIADALQVTEAMAKAILGILTAVFALIGLWKREVIKEQVEVARLTIIAWLRPKTGNTSVNQDDSTSKPPELEKSLQLTADIDGVGRQQLKVGAADVVLGRSEKSAVSAPKDEEASARHAALYVENGILMVRDLGSSNRTFLNGTPIDRAEPVHDHDVIRFGRTEVRIYFGLV